MDSQIISALRLCPLFAGMEAAGIEEAMAATGYRIAEYGAQEVYAVAGIPCKYADIVVSGVLVCRMASFSGKQVEVSRLKAGDVVAPAFIFSHDRSMPVSVETDTKVAVLRMTREAFKELIDRDGQLRMNFIRTLSDIDVFLTRKMKILSLFTVREKVAYLLLERAGEQMSETIQLHRSRQEIADSFGIQKFSLLRVLSEFEKEGAIRVNGRTIEILDRRRLK